MKDAAAEPSKPVLGRPPLDADDAELDAWVNGLLDALLGPEEETDPSLPAGTE